MFTEIEIVNFANYHYIYKLQNIKEIICRGILIKLSGLMYTKQKNGLREKYRAYHMEKKWKLFEPLKTQV